MSAESHVTDAETTLAIDEQIAAIAARVGRELGSLAVPPAIASGTQPSIDPDDPDALAAVIDHTALKPDTTAGQIRRLCAEAAEYRFASVCVNPSYVALATEALRGHGVPVCTVAGFPLGATPAIVKAYETATAVLDGAREVDMVIDIGALKSDNIRAVYDDIAAVVEQAHAGSALVKVIIEAALLTDAEKIAACLLSVAAGADYVKTSTGFGPGGATAGDVALMRRVVGPDIGVKAAGGIKTYADARAMIVAGATRIGASAGVAIVQAARR